jgi:hypothetical protein
MAEKDEEVAKAKAERDEVLARHARILSFAPIEVEKAYASILRIAASLGRVGSAFGPDLRSAVDEIRKYTSQVKAAHDQAVADAPTHCDAREEK